MFNTKLIKEKIIKKYKDKGIIVVIVCIMDGLRYIILNYIRNYSLMNNYKRIEFVCPFHRGDVLIGLMVAYTASMHGKKLRMHVSKSIIPWINDFHLPFDVLPIDIDIPPAKDTYPEFQKAMDSVSRRNDSSGYIIGSHPQFDFDFLGLDIVENMLNEFNLSIKMPLEQILPDIKDISKDDIALIKGKTAILHPYAGWKLKSMPNQLLYDVVKLVHSLGWKVIQIGGANDRKIDICDGWILKNESLGYWRNLFERSGLLIGVDSWTAHFAGILDIPQITFYGSTNARDVSSKKHYRMQKSKALIINTTAKCSPCHSFSCNRGENECPGFYLDEEAIKNFMREV